MSRLKTKPPKFFIILRNAGLVMASVSGALLAAPIALPAAIITAAGYLAVGGSVMAAISQLPNPAE